MNECFTFCILTEPGFETFTPLYFALLFLLILALVVSFGLTRSISRSRRRLQAFSPVKILSNAKTQICLVVVLQIVVLASFQAKYAQVVKTGRTIKLEANPLDPVDLFRGNYQALNFPQARLCDSKVRFHNLSNTSTDTIVYVVFQTDGNVWKATDVYSTKPEWSSQSIVMKGRIVNYWKGNLVLHYGIEQYFFSKGEVNMTKGAAASVHVDDNGDAVLTDLVASSQPAVNESK
jgi:uncharacterized membrane-anchored protein